MRTPRDTDTVLGAEYARSLAIIQDAMQRYLEKYVRANRLPLRHDIIASTFVTLISGEEPAPEYHDLVKQYLDILAANSAVMAPFKMAIRLKIMTMTASGMGSDAMRIVRQLNRYNIRALDLDPVPPDLRRFIQNVQRMASAIDELPIPVPSPGHASRFSNHF